MTRLLALVAAALAIGLTPVLAANTGASSQPPTASVISPNVSKEATVPPSGSPDTSGGATEQSSSPPSAGSTMSKPMTTGKTTLPSNPLAPSAND
jgi:hypothetical protein